MNKRTDLALENVEMQPKKQTDGVRSLSQTLYFCARRYNMHLTHCSLLLEIGSDGNTLEEAVYSGRCVGKALARLMEKYI